MAQTDLTGFLTGITSAPIDPRDSMTALGQDDAIPRSSEA